MKSTNRSSVIYKLVLTGVLCFLAGLAVAISSAPLAEPTAKMYLELETGKCKYGVAVDGTFYQSNKMTNNSLRPGCSSLALSGMFDHVNGWRIAYHDFGMIRARNNRFTLLDEEGMIAPAALPPCNPTTRSGCLGTMYGEGRSEGVSFALTRRVPFHGIDLLGEAGLLFFRSSFYAWATRDDAEGVMTVREKSSYWNRPDPMLGIGLRWGAFHVMARKYFTLGHRAQSLTDHSITELVVGVRMEF